MKFTYRILGCLFSAAFVFSANAGLIDYGVSTYVSGTYSGGDNMSDTYNEVDSQNKAMASLSGNSLLPTLKVMTASSTNVQIVSAAKAVQKFTYDGPAMSTFELNFNLHGDSVIYDGADMGYAKAGLFANVAVVSANEFYFDHNESFFTNYYGSGEEPLPGYTELAYGEVSTDVGFDQNTAGSLVFDIKPGDSFFVFVGTGAVASLGYVDAWNTFTMDFTDNTGLTAASFTPPVSVPEPSSILLMFSALVLFSSRKTFNK